MVRTRNGWLVAAALVALGGVACKKAEDKKTDQTAAADKGGDKGGDKAGMMAPGKAGAPISGAVGDDLGMLPADSDVVLGLNFAQLQQSPVWKQFSPKIMAKIASGLSDVQTACGFNPLDTIKSGAVGFKGVGGAGDPSGAIIIHGLDKTKVMGCMDKAKAEAAKHQTDITVDGDTFTVSEQGKPNHVMVWQFTNGDTLFGVFGAGSTKDSLAAAAKGGSALKTSATFVEMFGKINAGDSLWYMVNGNAPFMAKAGGMGGVQPKALFGSLAVTDGLALDARVRFGSPDEATQVVAMLKSQLTNPQVKNMFDKLDVNPEGADVKFGVALGQQKLMQLVTMAGAMMPGGGMGGAPAGAP